jgi:CRP/FNR family transcriptional regulator, cyclic AMP receptor protein
MAFPIEENNWIDRLPEHIRSEVLASMTSRRFGKGESVYSQGDESTALYLVTNGAVTINNLSQSGKEFDVGLINAGQCFGELGLIDGLPRANNAVAGDEAELLILGKDDFWRLRDLHREVADQLLLFVNHRLRLAYMMLQSSSLSGLPQQLAQRLYYLVESHSIERPEGFEITLKLSQEELGRSLGVSRQSINKAIKSLLEEDLVRIGNGKILVPDPDRLRAFAEF